ncbi:MAG: hypothetical protein KDD62_00405 [Bdellovibrionales bacterium]|nr:hypothetical protein [Bdellovibrionales bacterium]
MKKYSRAFSLVIVLFSSLSLFAEQRDSSQAAVEAFFKDDHGSQVIDPEFDSVDDHICGNGKSYYWTSVPPQKPIPRSWVMPPEPQSDPSYQGPDPLAELKESPYAMPSSKKVLRRPKFQTSGAQDFFLKALPILKNAQEPVAVYDASKQQALVTWLEEQKQTYESLTEALESYSQEQVAKLLSEKKINYLLVNRQQPERLPWVDQELASIASRLREAIPLRDLTPVLLDRGFALYVFEPRLALEKATKQTISDYIRSTLKNEKVKLSSIPALTLASSFKRSVSIGVRTTGIRETKGRLLARGFGSGVSVADAVQSATKNLQGKLHRIPGTAKKHFNVSVPSDTQAAVDLYDIEVNVFQRPTELIDLSSFGLTLDVELGLHGLFLKLKGKEHYLDSSYAVHNEFSAAPQFFRKLLQRGELGDYLVRQDKTYVVKFDSLKRDEARLYRYEALSWIDGARNEAIVELYRGVPLKFMSEVTRDSLVKSVALGADWLARNQHADGQYAYRYSTMGAEGTRWLPGANIVRHALNPYSVLLVHEFQPDERWITSAKRGIDFTLRFFRTKGKRGVICHRDTPARYYNAKIGTNAVTMISLLKLAQFEPLNDSYQQALSALAEELLFMQDPNGHFRQYDVPPSHPYYGAESTIAPGEIILALARMYLYSKDKRYLEAAEKAVPYYMKAWRHMIARQTTDGIYHEEDRMNITGIIPWMQLAFNDLEQATKNASYYDLSFEMQQWLLDKLFYGVDRFRYPDYLGASYKVYSELPAMNTCQFVEGFAALYDLARRLERGTADEIQAQVLMGVRFCMQLQYDSFGASFFVPRPDEVLGAYRYHLGVLRVRNDYLYHAISAIAHSLIALRPGDYAIAEKIEQQQLRFTPELKTQS